MNTESLQAANQALFKTFNHVISLKEGERLNIPHKLSTVSYYTGLSGAEVELQNTYVITLKGENQTPKISLNISITLANSEKVAPTTPVVVKPTTIIKATPTHHQSKLPANGDPASKETEAAMLAALSKPSPPPPSIEDFKAVPAVNNKRKIEDPKGKEEETEDDLIILDSSSQPEKRNLLKKAKK
jgi:hypothetical protein